MKGTMKSCADSMTRRLLIFAVTAFLAVTLLGCQDPIVRDMETEHQRLGRICQQEIRQAHIVSGGQGFSGFSAPSRTESLFPAP